MRAWTGPGGNPRTALAVHTHASPCILGGAPHLQDLLAGKQLAPVAYKVGTMRLLVLCASLRTPQIVWPVPHIGSQHTIHQLLLAALLVNNLGRALFVTLFARSQAVPHGRSSRSVQLQAVAVQGI